MACFLPVLLSVFLTLAHALSLNDAKSAGLSHFRSECAIQQSLMPELLSALQAKDFSRSIVAYTAARPPYEQIETLAHVFPDLDAAIDARPYVYGTGEDDPNFAGFHLLERHIFRDQDLTASYEVGLALNESINALCDVLLDESKFTPADSWKGALALAIEVPAKKVASEEETWSDLSLMIFRNNFRGLWSQVEPYFKTELATEKAVMIAKGRYKEVQAVLNKIDPKNDFFTNAGTARPYSTVTLPERKTIIDAAYKLYDALVVVRDEVVPVVAEEEGDEEGEEVPTLDTDKYKKETAAGVAYFAELCRDQERLLGPIDAAIAAGDLAAAQRAYEVARPPYEQIETMAPSFLVLDRKIDARPYALPLGERDPEWQGFHKLERELFRELDLSNTKDTMTTLRGSIESLCTALEDEPERFSAEQTWEGLLALAFEVPAKKISSEEETWSDLSVMIFRENVKGVQALFEPFKPRMPADVAAKVDRGFEMIKSFIIYVVDIGNPWEGTKFRKYSELKVWERKAFSDMFYEYGRALQEAYDSLL